MITSETADRLLPLAMKDDVLEHITPSDVRWLLVDIRRMQERHEFIQETSIRIGRWLSAALEDPAVCDEFKHDINEWFRAIDINELTVVTKEHDEHGGGAVAFVWIASLTLAIAIGCVLGALL